MQAQPQVKVWDPLVRFFHWVVVASFAIAYVTEEDFLTPHVWAGYTVLALLILRFFWGFVGTQHALFSDFVFAPRTVLTYLKKTLQRRAPRYLGHNPAGGAMIVVLLVCLALISLSGLLVYGAADHAGPLAALFDVATGKQWKEPLEEFHEVISNVTVLLVVIHVSGVVFESLVHRENLVRAMVTGYKRRD